MPKSRNFSGPLWIDFWATGFFVGYLKKAPGTWGTLVAVPLAVGLGFLPIELNLIAIFAFALFSIFIAQQYEEGSDRHDAQCIVIDEIAGYFVTMALMPLTWKAFLAGFILFRLLDIFKPFPISFLDRKIPGGFGVVADDLAAGLIGNLILQIVVAKTTWLSV
jgi:phosphatidylglycerophosphatase A